MAWQERPTRHAPRAYLDMASLPMASFFIPSLAMLSFFMPSLAMSSAAKAEAPAKAMQVARRVAAVSYTHLTLPTTERV